MHRSKLAFALVLVGLLDGCDTARYQNVAHPTFGDAEYKNDLAQCRRKNSVVVTSTGYEDRSETQVNEADARACMTELGWQPAR